MQLLCDFQKLDCYERIRTRQTGLPTGFFALFGFGLRPSFFGHPTLRFAGHLQFSSILPSISCQTSHPTFCSCHQLCALFSHSVTVGHFTFTFGNREKIWIRLLASCASRTSTSTWSVVLAWKTHFFSGALMRDNWKQQKWRKSSTFGGYKSITFWRDFWPNN